VVQMKAGRVASAEDERSSSTKKMLYRKKTRRNRIKRKWYSHRSLLRKTKYRRIQKVGKGKDCGVNTSLECNDTNFSIFKIKILKILRSFSFGQ